MCAKCLKYVNIVYEVICEFAELCRYDYNEKVIKIHYIIHKFRIHRHRRRHTPREESYEGKTIARYYKSKSKMFEKQGMAKAKLNQDLGQWENFYVVPKSSYGVSSPDPHI